MWWRGCLIVCFIKFVKRKVRSYDVVIVCFFWVRKVIYFGYFFSGVILRIKYSGWGVLFGIFCKGWWGKGV